MNSAQASHASHLAALYRQDKTIICGPTDGPLHVAAALGLPRFAREIVGKNPELALGFDTNGLTPCHVAIANGHVSVVKELLGSTVGCDFCSLRDMGGFLPVHAAIMKGRLDVLEEVRGLCPLSTLRESTWQGDSILHLAVKFDSFPAFRYFFRLFHGDRELFDRKDADGNTVLHISVARRQLEVVKMLVGHSNKKASQIDVNAVNQNGSTCLDIFLNSEITNADTVQLGDIIRRAGGQRAAEMELPRRDDRDTDELESGEPKTLSTPKVGDEYFTLRQRIFAMKIALSRRASDDKDKETGNTLMVVATLIATISFQGVVNPPGGFIQEGKSQGQAVLESVVESQGELGDFLFFDMMALTSSLSVILLTIYVVPLWKDMIKVTKFLTWASVCSTVSAFLAAVGIIFPGLTVNTWICAMIFLGDLIVQLFALFLWVRTWYFLHKCSSTLLRARSPRQPLSTWKRIAVITMAGLGASVLWVPWLSLDVASYLTPFQIFPHFINYPTGDGTVSGGAPPPTPVAR